MATSISDDDVDRIARRVVQLIGERLRFEPAPPPQPKPEPKPERTIAPVKARLAYTVKQLAAELNLSPISIYRLEARGLLQSVPGIRRKLYSHKQVERFLSQKAIDWDFD